MNVKCTRCNFTWDALSESGTHGCPPIYLNYIDYIYIKDPVMEKKKGLNIVDAVKSGKRFRRKGGAWIGEFTLKKAYCIGFYEQDILATDWEIEERKIEITESEFDEAWITTEIDRPEIFKIELKRRLFDK